MNFITIEATERMRYMYVLLTLLDLFPRNFCTERKVY